MLKNFVFYVSLAWCFILFFQTIICSIRKTISPYLAEANLFISFSVWISLILFSLCYDDYASILLYTIATWTFGLLCVIIQKKVAFGAGWDVYLMWLVDRIFLSVEQVRDQSKKTRAWLAGHRVLAGLILVAFVALCALLQNYHLFLLALVVVGLYVSVLLSRNSCRGLLVFWLVGGLVFFGTASWFITELFGSALTLPSFVHYIFFTIFYTCFWCVIAAISDDEAAILATKIVNTFTTVCVILVNVTAYYFSDHPIEGFSSAMWHSLQVYSCYVLLPLIVAGYCTQLFKELQIYWRKKYPDSKLAGEAIRFRKQLYSSWQLSDLEKRRRDLAYQKELIRRLCQICNDDEFEERATRLLRAMYRRDPSKLLPAWWLGDRQIYNEDYADKEVSFREYMKGELSEDKPPN